jgi:hypothetical protein
VATERLIGRLATAVTIGCVAVVAITLGALALPSVRAKLGFPAARPVSYPIGDRIDVPASLYESAGQTLFVFARSSCTACQRSKPALTEIVAQIRRTPAARILVVTSDMHRASEVAYANDLGLDDAQVIGLNLDGLRLRVVPTLVLVDQRGRIHYTSEGMISPGQEEELLRAVTSLAVPH